jgi:ubiquinone/menaquinone biosynthesis C-methylase UbiE
MTRFLRFFFWHFYHGFAWTYDTVAAVVSIGRWNDWINCVLPYVKGRRVLEIGHGPGHLQTSLHQDETRLLVGLDESPQMGRLARSRLLKAGHARINLTRGMAQVLPFKSGSFDDVVSTFPAEYIFESATLYEVRRVLADGGRFIVLPAAWILGRKVIDRSAAWLFRTTQQAPVFPPEVMSRRLQAVFQDAGFKPEFETSEMRASQVLIVIARA